MRRQGVGGSRFRGSGGDDGRKPYTQPDVSAPMTVPPTVIIAATVPPTVGYFHRRLPFLVPRRRAADSADAAAQGVRGPHGPRREVPPVPDVQRSDLVVHGRERRTAARLEQQRGGTEVVVRRRRQARSVGLEDRRE